MIINYRATLRVGMPFWTLCVLFVFVALCVAQRFCDVSAIVVEKHIYSIYVALAAG
ncbi:hypothetical protein ALQ64_01690 [Pseudomonas cannabina]|uniref:Uncharacterized protein n=1 Tax=Pseudomonas cannabina TaxID=86840 RepID=A0A0P9MNN3_PSECA|nr:hypothetical protein ALO81_03762 [Pseudomonas cannabina]RMN18710.1 hypothetical protein ALQ64_01690 [Pseudomonas cannabina]